MVGVIYYTLQIYLHNKYKITILAVENLDLFFYIRDYSGVGVIHSSP